MSENPFQTWAITDELALPRHPGAGQYLDEALDRLEGELAKEQRRDFYRVVVIPAYLLVPLSPSQRKRAERLYLALWHTPGSGKHMAEKAMLGLLGYTADSGSIPFWKEAISLGKVGDGNASARRRLAAAALARTAMLHPRSAALDSLRELTVHDNPDVRESVVESLAFVLQDDEGPATAAIVEMLTHVAASDRAFGPRFLARRFLGVKPPDYEPKSVLVFEVSFGKVRRTLELRADQTLDDLHGAILAAFGWDSDHLYTFYLNGDPRDRRFEMPYGGGPPDFGDFYEMDPEGAGGAPAEEGAREEELTLGMLGLPVGHKFLYRYDFGDDHRFKVRVTDIHPKAARVKYPRVVAKVGKAPPQYQSW